MFRTLLTAGAVLTLCSTVQAQRAHEVREDRRERREDHREVAKDKQEIRDDVHDLRSLQRLLEDFDSARARSDVRALRQIDGRLKWHVQSELSESGRELRDDRREVGRSEREVRDERREVRRDEASGHPGKEAADRRDLRDDKRDLRDDVRDAQAERAKMNRYVELLREVAGLEGRMEPPALERKRMIIGEMIARARGEIREDQEEIREDKRELREDRHETREDRREHHR
ncbi:MAG TPA: hypothetical protein VGK67_33155 [Myxococcales bacterium]|jgi:hypothetical protein